MTEQYARVFNRFQGNCFDNRNITRKICFYLQQRKRCWQANVNIVKIMLFFLQKTAQCLEPFQKQQFHLWPFVKICLGHPAERSMLCCRSCFLQCHMAPSKQTKTLQFNSILLDDPAFAAFLCLVSHFFPITPVATDLFLMMTNLRNCFAMSSMLCLRQKNSYLQTLLKIVVAGRRQQH